MLKDQGIAHRRSLWTNLSRVKGELFKLLVIYAHSLLSANHKLFAYAHQSVQVYWTSLSWLLWVGEMLLPDLTEDSCKMGRSI
jgi:hypothetical protein